MDEQQEQQEQQDTEKATPRRRRRKPRKSKVRWGRIIPALIVIVLIVVGVAYGINKGWQAYQASKAAQASGQDTTSQVATDTTPPKPQTVPLEQKAVDKPIYILVVGKNNDNPALGDAIFLVSVNIQQNNVDVIGIPSNTKIDSRDHKSVAMINSMYATGGLDLTKAVVEDLFHITIPYYVVLDDNGFKKAVSVWGNGDLYVEREMVHMDAATNTADINLARGYQTMTPDKALQYVRFVDENGDAFSRTQRQERYLKEMLTSADDSFTVSKMFHVWRMWSSFETNISTSDAVNLMFKLRSLKADQIHYYILPGTKETIKGKIYWTYDPTEAQQLVGITLGNTPVDLGTDSQQQEQQAQEGQSSQSTTKSNAKGI